MSLIFTQHNETWKSPHISNKEILLSYKEFSFFLFFWLYREEKLKIKEQQEVKKLINNLVKYVLHKSIYKKKAEKKEWKLLAIFIMFSPQTKYKALYTND